MKRGVRVLVVDDDRHLGETLNDILEARGHKARFVDSGRAALKILEKRPYDVILLDIKMQPFDGLDTLKRIKQIRPDTIVIMMTAYVLEDVVRACLQEGAAGVLYKPVNIEKVVALVETVKNGILILVIDDDPVIRDGLEDGLQQRGYYVATAKDGDEAVHAAMLRYDVVIVDIKQPVINSLEIYLTMKEISPGIKAVFMTSCKEDTQEQLKEALKINRYALISKPFVPLQIIDMIDEVVNADEAPKDGRN
ncbi:MAG: response regulator [Candidatus Omnitrophota bacterium]|jgi:DNA-binding NtrC family response regulator